MVLDGRATKQRSDGLRRLAEGHVEVGRCEHVVHPTLTAVGAPRGGDRSKRSNLARLRRRSANLIAVTGTG